MRSTKPPQALNYYPLGSIECLRMTRAFGQFARKERLEDRVLCEAIERAERGIVDADLGGGVIKQRVARPGQGRSGGYRTLIAFCAGRHPVRVAA